MAQSGKTDEAVSRLTTVIGELRQINSFAGVVSYHDTSKKLLHILLNFNLICND